MNAVWIVAGLSIILLTAFDIFQSVIVPRPTGRRFRPSGFLNHGLWLVWKRVAVRVRNADRREYMFGAYAPFMLVTLLVFWILSLIVGYGAIFYAFRTQIKPVPGFFEAVYFAGTSLVTVGFGDYEPTGVITRVLAIFAGGSGFGAFAIITAFLFPIFGSYQQREAFVVMFTNRAGAPPSGVDMIEAHAQLGMMDGLVTTIRESELWMAQVLETHLAYPILTYFRSTHDDISWVAVVGTILDASTLVITTLETDRTGEAKIVNRLGRHFVNDFARYFELRSGDDVGIDRAQYDIAYDRLGAAGIALRERENAWAEFGAIRSTYASQLNHMAKFWEIPAVQWFGDRSMIPHHGPLEIPADGEPTSTPV